MERNLFYEQLEKQSEQSKPSPIREIIEDAMRKKDRWISLIYQPDGTIFVNIYPLSEEEEE